MVAAPAPEVVRGATTKVSLDVFYWRIGLQMCMRLVDELAHLLEASQLVIIDTFKASN